jgi:hypothetical protein
MAKKRVEKRPEGRPSKYKPEFCQLGYNYCLLGATDKGLASFFEVSEDTIHEWKKVYPEFSESLKAGKEQADAVVASSLFHRATGFSHPDTDIKIFKGRIIKTPLTKHYPPDSTAAIFWLKNRNPKQWRDKQEIEHSGVVEKQVMIIGGQKIEF